MACLERNIENRDWLIDRLRCEIVGPDPSGEAIETDELQERFFTWDEFRRPKMQKNGEEILWLDPPIKRYGAGILFPAGITEQKQLQEDADSTPIDNGDNDIDLDIRIDEYLEKKVHDDVSKIKTMVDDTEDYEVNLANSYRPSAMGLSFLTDFNKEKNGIKISIFFSTYKKCIVNVGKNISDERISKRELWLRMPGFDKNGKVPEIHINTEEIINTKEPLYKWVPCYENNLQLVLVSRTFSDDKILNQRLLTVCIVNKKQEDAGRVDENCFFQCGFKIEGVTQEKFIIPYPDISQKILDPADEEEISKLLYRDKQTFGIGHGCSADWPGEKPESVNKIWTEVLPSYETPSISADIFDNSGNPIKVSMRKLAGLDDSDTGNNELLQLIDSYKIWINSLKNFDDRIPPIPPKLQNTAKILIDRHEKCLKRIVDGYEYLNQKTDFGNNIRNAFKLANHAMLISQLRSTRGYRVPSWDNGKIKFDKDIQNPDPKVENPKKGYWRAFQIAFLLMSLKGICEKEHSERKIVDLIWFPTGGGKTEAYLGLISFTIFYNRLAKIKVSGTEVIMRYTLRLLTAQQFQRAGLLFCAMEYLRKTSEYRKQLGEKQFRIGMWVGGGATPNKRSNAKIALSNLQKNPESENPFILLKCPWCAAKFGPIQKDTQGKKTLKRRKNSFSPLNVVGYTKYRVEGRRSETVVFRCYDPNCYFGQNPIMPGKPFLPITVIDEDIYEFPPSLIIGTVDKFALLSWKPEARSIFGLNSDGSHANHPPSLIIQDELHLISGPLGSMVGSYETVIEELCTYEKDGITIKPKIVASTATISRAKDQVQSLYARDKVALFPPSGLEAGDSFFACEDRDQNGNLKPGRLYLGIMAPGHGSQQTTQARVYAALLQYPLIMPVLDGDETERDPWWTLLCFFNSLRELGGAATLMVADTRDYLRVLLNRHGIGYDKIRQLLNWEELTSRIRDDKIPLAIQKLEIPFTRDKKGFVKDTVEACLASNIIEVGIDIDRLSLMTIVGQPKTTSQYIQVSSRIGRNIEAPGLVVIVYSQSKPRDRSHYERFRSYHQRLYAQVEPTSVTPFSPPAVDRSLHSVIVSAVRQMGKVKVAESPRPYPLDENTEIRNKIIDMILKRVRIVDPEEERNVSGMAEARLKEWQAWDPSDYGGFGAPPLNAPLLHPAGSRALPDWDGHSWPTMSSMRDVDATCEAEITTFYNEIKED